MKSRLKTVQKRAKKNKSSSSVKIGNIKAKIVTIRDIHIGPSIEEYERNLSERESKRKEDEHWSVVSTDLIQKIVFIDSSYIEMKLKVARVLNFIQEDVVRNGSKFLENYPDHSILSQSDVTTILRAQLSKMLNTRCYVGAARASYYLGEFYQVYQNSIDADKNYSLAVDLDPANLVYRISAGETALSRGMFKRAEELFGEALDYVTDGRNMELRFQVLNGYGSALFYQNRYNDALLIYKNIVFENAVPSRENSQTATALNNLGWIMFKCGDVEEGLEFLINSLKMKKRNGDSAASCTVTLCNLAHVYMSLNRLDDAYFCLDDGEKIVKLEYARLYPCHPILARLYNQRGVLKVSERKFRLAAIEFEKGVFILEDQFGRYHEQTLIALHNMFLAFENGFRYILSRKTAEQLCERMRRATVSSEFRKAFEEDYEQIFGKSLMARMLFRFLAAAVALQRRCKHGKLNDGTALSGGIRDVSCR
jgi:tetratricopeptide (TPR) repeat protein